MKKIFLVFSIITFAIATQAQPPAGEANKGDWYGEKITADGAINIAEIPAKLETNSIIDTKIKGKILEVCAKKGCWVTLQVNDSTTAMVKMKDYGFFLPVAAIGKTVVLDGKIELKTTSVEELRHYAEDARKTPEEIAAIVQPKKEISVMAKGIVVVD
ncbi:MAG: DUF4920 domain-containing protein [Chitinophagaceae bacterium]|jgi:hypothetical protein|nr:DUF4920 domain-containing protein [Chitinophagaceae bacterium]